MMNCYSKASADEWIGTMRHAHLAGLRTTATMMFGSVETGSERIEHMMRLRALRDETGGFTAFITWSYQPPEHRAWRRRGHRHRLSAHAVGRAHRARQRRQPASWVTQGGKVGQLSLFYGANNRGSVMIEENVVRAAGASYCMGEVAIVRNVENAGFTAKRRNMHYDIRGDPIYRERDVPRMLELAVARADGQAGEAEELRQYEARTPAARKQRQRP